jgi:O-antigen ligase
MFDKGTSSWHNDFLQVYMESGIVGLCAMLYFIFSVFKNGLKAIKQFKKSSDRFHKDLASGLLLSFLAFLIGGFLLDPILAMFFLLVVSLITLLIVRSREYVV